MGHPGSLVGKNPQGSQIGCAVLGKQLKKIIIFPGTPDFLSRLVALSNSMRLSLKKAAHAVLSDAA
jgi:hypothetical protein